MKLPIQLKGPMTPGTETKIVAVLLLFFLAHLAFANECGMFEKPVSYYCGLVTSRNINSPDPSNAKKTITEHREWWGSTPNAGQMCVKTDYSSRGTFDHKFTKAFHVKGNDLIPYDPELSIAARVSRTSGDLVIGIRLVAENARAYASTQYKAKIFIHQLAMKRDQGAITHEAFWYQDFPEAPAVEIDGTYGSSSVTLQDGTSLACAFQIGDLQPGM
jgi:hypothetical protein